MNNLRNRYETFVGEDLKKVAEHTLQELGSFALGRAVIETYAFGSTGRIEDPALHTTVADINFENPVIVGAGWTKMGRAGRGLYHLGFGGVEFGTIPLFGQPGNPKSRLWTINDAHDVANNRLGFNSDGSEVAERFFNAEGRLPFPVGINVGLNKDMPHEHAPWAHAKVITKLYRYADYFALGVSSPNTPGLRSLQSAEHLRSIITAAKEAMEESGGQKPLFIKIAPDLTLHEIDGIAQVASDLRIAGIIATNTTISPEIKAKYGPRWSKEAGGLSGNDWEYRMMSAVIIRHIYELYERIGEEMDIIGVGGIHDVEGTIEKMFAGASAVQLVTAMLPSKGRAGAKINKGLIDWMNRHNVVNIKEIIGAASSRGPKYPALQKPEKSTLLRLYDKPAPN